MLTVKNRPGPFLPWPSIVDRRPSTVDRQPSTVDFQNFWTDRAGLRLIPTRRVRIVIFLLLNIWVHLVGMTTFHRQLFECRPHRCFLLDISRTFIHETFLDSELVTENVFFLLVFQFSQKYKKKLLFFVHNMLATFNNFSKQNFFC